MRITESRVILDDHSLEMSNLQNGFRFIAQKSYRDSIAAHGSPIEAIDSSFLRPGIYQETYKKAFETAMSLFDTKLLLCQQPLEWHDFRGLADGVRVFVGQVSGE